MNVWVIIKRRFTAENHRSHIDRNNLSFVFDITNFCDIYGFLLRIVEWILTTQNDGRLVDGCCLIEHVSSIEKIGQFKIELVFFLAKARDELVTTRVIVFGPDVEKACKAKFMTAV